MVEIMKRILLFFLLFFVGCSSPTPKLGSYSIGRDPTWFPLRLESMVVNVNGFTNALVQELAKVEGKNFQIVDISWTGLFEGLEKHEYAGIFTSLDPNIITDGTYSFSNPFLLLGPVLVVPADSHATSLDDLKGSTVGVYQYDDSVLIAQQHPSILMEMYEHIPNGLEAVADGKVAGALIPNLEARALVDTEKLKIVTPPLSNKGLRLITLKGRHESLIKHFNRGLEKLQHESSYKKTRTHFGIK